jgi:RHS repeat-associated protein
MRARGAGRSAWGGWVARALCALLLAGAALGAQAGKSGGNQPPVVELTAPEPGASFVAPATIELAAEASDPDGTVTKVEFFSGSTLVGTATTAPYTATWSNVAAGSYTLTAKATDNGGASTTSAPVSIAVSSATELVVSSPANNAAFNVNTTLTVSGTFEGPEGSTILVDNQQSSVLATISGNTYTANLFAASHAVGPATLTVKLSRPDRTFAARSLTVVGYDSPRVAFVGPVCNVFEAPANILLAADARAPGATITQVQFFNGSTLIGTVSAPPYELLWSNVPAGNYSVTARAHNTHGLVTVSAALPLSVLGPNAPPSITITSPTEGATFQAPASIPITVDASDPDGTVTQVEYFANGSPIGVSNTAPFGITWSNVAAGSYALTARATDDRNGQTTSAPVNITVAPPNQPPTATLTSPTEGASFLTPATITLTATASDPDGTIDRVEFYAGTTLVGTATAAPYTVNWTTLASGPFTLTAKAIDNLGAAGDSAPVGITINGAVTFLHNDFAGNPIAATDAEGALLWKENFRPYGDRLNNPPASTGNRQWFHGKAVDADTGLSYFGARYYDPTLGRFMGVDPQHFVEDNLHSFNRYVYGNNNPYKYLDPDGRQATLVLCAAGPAGCVIGGAIAIGTAYYGGKALKDTWRLLKEKADNEKSEGDSKPLRDGENATPEQIENSQGGPTAGQPVTSGERQKILDQSRNPDGTWTCWRCGATTDDPGRIDIGHKNVPKSKGGNKSPDNLGCEGMSCNRSAGNRGEVKEGSDCKSKGGC